jgi:starch-binding outer membrane protein, SusD/RagB family
VEGRESDPTAITLGNAVTGLLIGNRTGHGAGNGYVAQLGIVGREAYSFDPADPRFIGELLEDDLNRGSPFGGAFWTPPYANIQLGHIILRAVDKVAGEGEPGGLSDEQKSGIRGFTRTMQALDLFRVTVTHDTNGIVIDTDRPVDAELAPLVDPDVAFVEIARLLDDAVPELAAGGDAFAFLLAEGFVGFDTPPTFLTFNRAFRARVAVYQKDYQAALTALEDAFIDDDVTGGIDLNVGVYYTFTTKGGDTALGLATPNLYAHPSVTADAEAGDARLARKTKPAKQAGGARGLSSSVAFALYPTPSTSVPLLRNEELILLKAEALWFSGQQVEALAELNLVRTLSGNLPAIVTAPADDAAFITALLYERRYSLLFEGHRLLDVRRFGRIATLPLDMPTIPMPPTHQRNIRWPIPQPECDARVGEERCMLGSTDP